MATTNPNHIFWQDIRGVYDPATGGYVFGDQSGNATGSFGMTLQSGRGNPDHVASGNFSTAVGYNSKASGPYSSAFGVGAVATALACVSVGRAATASNDYCTAVGYSSYATGLHTTAVGVYTHAEGVNSTALGYKAFCRIDKTINIGGAQIIRKDNSESSASNFETFCGARVVLFTNEVDLKIAASNTITIPTGAHFFPDEVGVIVTSANTVTVQPSIRFGNSGNHAALLAITAGSGLSAAFACNRFQTLVTSAGQQDLVAEITTGATATALLGRFYFTGRLVEDE